MSEVRQPAPRALLVAAIACAIATVFAIFVIDKPLARALAPWEPLAIWNAGIEVLEWIVLFPIWRMALPVGLVVGMLVTVAVPKWRHHAYTWMFLASTHLVSILATRHLKELTQRVRPFKWVKEVAKHPANDATFFEGGSAFPSGHGTLFCSMAIGLAVVFPRARVPLLGVVGFVMCARVGVNDHWASDVLASVTLVTLVAWLVGLVIRPLPLPARR